MMMWPHHASLHNAGNALHLSIGVPGMDLSQGHSGGMPGMKGKILVLDGIKGIVQKNQEVPVANHNAAYSPDGKEIWTSRMDMDGEKCWLPP